MLIELSKLSWIINLVRYTYTYTHTHTLTAPAPWANPRFLPRHDVLCDVNPTGIKRLEYRHPFSSRWKLPSSHHSWRAPLSIMYPRGQVSARSSGCWYASISHSPLQRLPFLLSTYVCQYSFTKFIPSGERDANIYLSFATEITFLHKMWFLFFLFSAKICYFQKDSSFIFYIELTTR